MHGLRPAMVLAAALLASGCLGSTPNVPPVPAAPPSPAGGLVAHRSTGLVAVPAEAAALSVAILDEGHTGGEPTVGVDSHGAIYTTSGGSIIRKSPDKGRTWLDVTGPRKPAYDVDPYVWVDPLTDRVFSAPLYAAYSDLAWTDDGGQTWDGNTAGGCLVPGHDHQSLATGPPPAGVQTTGYPDVVYYAYNSFRYDGTWACSSLDGGRTWGAGTNVRPRNDCHLGLNGAPAVAPDGTAYLPMPRCEGLRVGVSKDAGRTWALRDIDDVGMLGSGRYVASVTPDTPNPGVAADAAGHAFAAYPGSDGRMYLAASLDGGATWSHPVLASPPPVTVTAFSAIVAGADGRVAIAYLGTAADPSGWQGRNAQYAPDGTAWHLYVTVSLDASAADPTFTTVRATPEGDPVQVGCIWFAGGTTPRGCRNLGDYIDITQAAGRAYVAYADGCRSCTAEADSHNDDLKVAVVDLGPSLLGGALVPYADEPLG